MVYKTFILWEITLVILYIEMLVNNVLLYSTLLFALILFFEFREKLKEKKV